MNRAALRSLLLATCTALPACSQLVQYTDELTDSDTGRTPLVTIPAAAGGFVGFYLVGPPVAVAALPVTVAVYQLQRGQNKVQADAVSTILFPMFVLWRAGTLIGTPFDMIDFVLFRLGRPPVGRSREENAAYEYELDDATLSKYPVETIYPDPGAAETKKGGKG